MKRRLTDIAHDHVRDAVQTGHLAIDATVGNGHDTLFLARAVGDQGRVIGFDIQEVAIENTRLSLREANASNVDLILDSHADMSQRVPEGWAGNVSAVMFNLGYLPGADKSVITQTASTTTGIESALGLVRTGGVVTVMAYPGHPGGEAELQAVEQLCESLSADEFIVVREPQPRPSAPCLFVIKRSM